MRVRFPGRLGYSTIGKVKEEGALSSAGETQHRTFVFRMTLMNVVIIWEAEDDEKDE